jgi:hypothetical protein
MSCHVCKKLEEHCESLRCCSKCKSRSYCSKECQLKHWKTGHKKECSGLQNIRDNMALRSADSVSAIGDPPPASEIDGYNARAQHFEQQIEFSFDCQVDTTKGNSWNRHVQDIMSRDPSTRTKTASVDMIVLDCTDMFRRSDGKVRKFSLKIEPCLAIFQSIRSDPHGGWGFQHFCYMTADDPIWENGPNKGPWTCYKCQNPETRRSSMSCKFSLFPAPQKVLMVVFRLPVCPQCVPSASREVLSIETKVRKMCRETQLTL